MALQVVVKRITPDKAQAILRKNSTNRPVISDVVDCYARDMKAGKWVTTHQGILLGHKGALIDGQHRLLAVVKSGVAVDMAVATDVRFTSPLDVPLDMGAKRGANYSLDVSTALVANAQLGLKLLGVRKPTLSETREMADLLAPHHAKLSTRTRKKISAPFRLAACAHLMRGTDERYVVSVYDAMVGDYKTLPPYPASLFSQVVVDGIGFDTYDLIARAVRAFEPANREKKRLQIKNRDYALEESLAFVRTALTDGLALQ